LIPEKFTQYFGDLYVFCTFVDTSRANKRFASCSKQIHSCRLDSHLQTWILCAESQPARWSSSTSPPVQLNQPSSPAQPAAHRSSSTCPPVQLNPPPPAGPAQTITRSGGIIYTLNQPQYINCTPLHVTISRCTPLTGHTSNTSVASIWLFIYCKRRLTELPDFPSCVSRVSVQCRPNDRYLCFKRFILCS
jgi:hypothetical protein